jgi:hypothetical protein
MEMSFRTGYKRVSNWQRHAIITTFESENRAAAAESLEIPLRTLDDLLYRAYKTLGCRNLEEAYSKVHSKSFTKANQ